MLLASRQVKAQELAEGSPDHLGETLDVAEAPTTIPVSPPANSPGNPTPGSSRGAIVPVALRQETVAAPDAEPAQSPAAPSPQPAAAIIPGRLPSSGTVVLDVEQSGIVVPSFAGKSVRGAIELAEDSGLDLDAVGSGLAREQSPAAGSHVVTGSRVTVKFGR